MGCRSCGKMMPGWMGHNAICNDCDQKLNGDYYKQEAERKSEEERRRWSCHIHPNGSYTREEGCWDCMREADQKRKK
ncbi:hypothetical protein [Flavobacterium sp.]|uniref:hypothetical protein n=1 Tax=Flavobacterium sp. TaxID=239 RepID=UPI00262711C8|nr:hypothetical protein [Flavobacterium sp.]